MADSQLATFLADRDEPCPACNYNLRGLKTDRCPECNRELVLQIRLSEPRMGAWIAALAASAAMLGFNGLLVVYFIVWVMTHRYGGGPSGGSIASLVISAILSGFIVLWLVRRRRAFTNLSKPARIGLATGVWLLTAASAASFFVLVER